MFVDADDYIETDLLSNLSKYMDRGIEIIKYNIEIKSRNEPKRAKKRIVTNIYPMDKSKKRNGYKLHNVKKRANQKFEKKNQPQIKNKKKNQPQIKKSTGEEVFNDICFKEKFLDSPCLYLIKKELIERTKLEFEEDCYHEDFGLLPQLIINAKTMVVTDYRGYIYIQSENSIMRNRDYQKSIKKVKDKLMLYDKMLDNIKYFNVDKKTIKNLKQYYTNSIISSLNNLENKERRIFIKQIKKKKLIKNIQIKNVKQLVRRIILDLNMDLYLRHIRKSDAI